MSPLSSNTDFPLSISVQFYRWVWLQPDHAHNFPQFHPERPNVCNVILPLRPINVSVGNRGWMMFVALQRNVKEKVPTVSLCCKHTERKSLTFIGFYSHEQSSTAGELKMKNPSCFNRNRRMIYTHTFW